MQMERMSGILAHPTSFPGKYGIGDLGTNAYAFVDFLKKGNQKLWQVLPLGPTSFGDSPYQSFSTFAGNQYLISPELLLDEGYLEESDLQDIPDFDLLRVEYGEVIQYKMELLRTAYQNFNERGTHLQNRLFQNFCKKNQDWLDDYALFVAIKNHFIKERKNEYETETFKLYQKKNKEYLSENAVKDYYYGAVWNSWPDALAQRDKTALIEWRNTLTDEIRFNQFVQFEFYRQWDLIKKYANENDIQVIGDIPIFVAMDSSDVWANRQLYYIDAEGYPQVVAGVPPDYFSEDGQLWGNPLYNWDRHKETKYEWWLARIRNALKTVDIVRIDHFRGFESYWAVPYGAKTAVKGEWKTGPGHGFFDAIEQSLGKLPIIAEDLGIITDEVTELRESVGFPGMKVLQFAFDGSNNNDYLPHNFKNSYTVLYSGTHDNNTSIGWYEKADDEAKDYFRRYLNVSGTDVSWDMIRLAMSSTASYAIVPIQDVMRLDEEHRMNTPGVASKCWQFRFTNEMLLEEHAEALAYFTKMYNR